jgi:hypothetical protein
LEMAPPSLHDGMLRNPKDVDAGNQASISANSSPNYRIIGADTTRHRQSKLMLGAAFPLGPQEYAVI